jgi:hypothetical protein
MKKIKKSMLKSYAVFFVGIALMIVGGVSFLVNAQTDKDPNILDQIMSSFLQLKLNEIATAPAPVVEPAPAEPTVGYSAKPGDVVLTKFLDYDDITTTGVAITNPATGEFYVDNVIMEMGPNTIASGTLMQIISTQGSTAYSDFGTSTPLFSTQVSAFTKNLTMDLNTAIGSGSNFAGYASSTQRVVLADGAYLTALCTTADCKLSTTETELGTADRNMKVTVVLKRVDSNSSIYE